MAALWEAMCLDRSVITLLRVADEAHMCIVTPIDLRSETWSTGLITSRPRSFTMRVSPVFDSAFPRVAKS